MRRFAANPAVLLAAASVACVLGLAQTYDTPGVTSGSTWNAPVAYASIPACSTSAFFQPLNDSDYSFAYCDGASTLSYYRDGRRMYPVANGSYSWDNQGSATLSTTTGTAVLTTPAASGDNLRVRYLTAPSTPYTITALIRLDMMNVSTHNAGLVFRQSSDGKLASCTVSQSTSIRYESTKWTNSTTFSATYTSLDEQIAAPFEEIWIRIGDNATNRTCEVSIDGRNWRSVHSVGRTDFLTADQVGFYGNTVNVTHPLYVSVMSWQAQ